MIAGIYHPDNHVHSDGLYCTTVAQNLKRFFFFFFLFLGLKVFCGWDGLSELACEASKVLAIEYNRQCLTDGGVSWYCAELVKIIKNKKDNSVLCRNDLSAC